MKGTAVQADRPRPGIDQKGSAADRPVVAAVLAQSRLDPGQEDGAVDALGEVVGGTVLQATDLVACSMAGTGEDEHRAGGAVGTVADQVEDLDRVHVGELEVEDGQVGQVLARDTDSLCPGVGDHDLITGALEDAHRDRRQSGASSTTRIAPAAPTGRTVHPFQADLKSV